MGYNIDRNNEKRDEAEKLLRTGKFSAAEIAREMGIKGRTVRQWRADLGISPTRRERKHRKNSKPSSASPARIGTSTPLKTAQTVTRTSNSNSHQLVSPPSGPIYEDPQSIQPQATRSTAPAKKEPQQQPTTKRTPPPVDLTLFYKQRGLARREEFNPYDVAPFFNLSFDLSEKIGLWLIGELPQSNENDERTQTNLYHLQTNSFTCSFCLQPYVYCRCSQPTTQTKKEDLEQHRRRARIVGFIAIASVAMLFFFFIHLVNRERY